MSRFRGARAWSKKELKRRRRAMARGWVPEDLGGANGMTIKAMRDHLVALERRKHWAAGPEFRHAHRAPDPAWAERQERRQRQWAALTAADRVKLARQGNG